jgi:hypothetical protein
LTRPEAEREALRSATKFGIFVVHNKKKIKMAEIPNDVPFVEPKDTMSATKLTACGIIRYFSGADVEDVW